MSKNNFEVYRQHPDPEKQERASNWRMAIGLLVVDGLTTTDYLIETARKHIEGEVTIDEAQELIKEYHRSKKNSSDATNSKNSINAIPTSTLISPMCCNMQYFSQLKSLYLQVLRKILHLQR